MSRAQIYDYPPNPLILYEEACFLGLTKIKERNHFGKCEREMFQNVGAESGVRQN